MNLPDHPCNSSNPKQYIHNCYQFGHIWEIKEINDFLGTRIISICRVCGKIGDVKK